MKSRNDLHPNDAFKLAGFSQYHPKREVGDLAYYRRGAGRGTYSHDEGTWTITWNGNRTVGGDLWDASLEKALGL